MADPSTGLFATTLTSLTSDVRRWGLFARHLPFQNGPQSYVTYRIQEARESTRLVSSEDLDARVAGRSMLRSVSNPQIDLLVIDHVQILDPNVILHRMMGHKAS